MGAGRCTTAGGSRQGDSDAASSGPDSAQTRCACRGSDGGIAMSAAVGYARGRRGLAPDISLELLTPPERASCWGPPCWAWAPRRGRPGWSRGAERCAAALQTLATLPRERKATRLGQLARELGAPFPPAVELCHRELAAARCWQPSRRTCCRRWWRARRRRLREAVGELLQRPRRRTARPAAPRCRAARDGHRAAPAGVRRRRTCRRRRRRARRSRRCWTWTRPGCARRCGGWGRGRWARPLAEAAARGARPGDGGGGHSSPHDLREAAESADDVRPPRRRGWT